MNRNCAVVVYLTGDFKDLITFDGKGDTLATTNT